MNNGRTISILLVIALLVQPSSALAQQRFNPNATLGGSGGTFGGVQFSGVGAAVLGCTNVGGGISGLFSKGTSSLAGLFRDNPTSRLSTPTYTQTGASQANQTINAPSTTPTPSSNSAVSSSVSGNTASQFGTAGDQSVPVNAEKTDEELQKANKREDCLNGIAYAVAKSLLQQVTNKTLSWINTGFGGNPLYIRDIDSFLTTISDEHIDRFLQDIPRRDPIFGNAIRSIVTQQVSGVRDGYIDRVMDTPEARAYEEFQDDFTNGGWDTFLNPRNNIIDSVFDAAGELAIEIETEQQNAQNELMQSGGFLNMKACVEFEDTSELDEYIEKCNRSEQEICSPRALQDAVDQVTNPKCIKYETVTPGSVIAAQVEATTTSHIRQLEQADQINEVLGAFFDQLLNTIFSKGLSSIGARGDGQWGSGGFGTNVVLGSNGQPISSANTGVLGYQSSSAGGYDVADFDISRPQQLRGILQSQYDYLNHSTDSRVALNRILPTLGALDYCMPGPNPTWKDGLAESANAYFGSLQEIREGTSLFERLKQTFPYSVFSVLSDVFSGIFGGNDKHAVAAVDVYLFDKTIGQDIPISATAFGDRASAGSIVGALKSRYDEIVGYYDTTYSKANIKNAFISVDPGNAAFAGGFVEDAYDEMANLPSYSRALFDAELEGGYAQTQEEVRDAIATLESIRSEVNQIVGVAKARYISEQAAAGTPVNLSCINTAYLIDSSPIVPVPRQESDAPFPLVAPSIEANNYFYNHL